MTRQLTGIEEKTALVRAGLEALIARGAARRLAALGALPRATPATDEEVMRLVEDRKLWGRGIGWIDAHLLASALLTNCRLWTLDRRLQRTASAAGVSLHIRG